MTDYTPRYVGGFYPEELDAEGPFQWLARRVEIDVDGPGLLIIEGRSPVPQNRVNIRTAQVSFSTALGANAPARVVVPLGPGNAQRVVVEFDAQLDAPGDTRELCFVARTLRVDPLAQHEAVTGAAAADTSAPMLAHGRGLLAGQVSTTFASGWLRMHARRVQDYELHVSGILVTPLERFDAARVTANGRVLEGLTYGLFNGDYAALGNVAFEGRIDLREFAGEAAIRFGSVFVRDGARATPSHQDWIYPLDNGALPLPDAANMKRIGSTDHEWFLFSGASFVGKLNGVLEGIGARPVGPDARVLDWGSGCGRLTRHLIGLQADVTGIDIDPVNIAWCREHLRGARFELVRPDLPTDLPQQHFDVAVGHSVLTHLTEVDQFLWLAEINRVLKPGGVAVLTVMANYSAAIEPFEPAHMAQLLSEGFLDVGWQADGVDSVKPGFYRRIFHTVDYVRERWRDVFQVIGVLEGYSDHQAAILLRKPG